MSDAPQAMTTVIARQRLARIADDIFALGVSRLAVFGSVARGEATADSDVDVLVEFEPCRKRYVALLDLADMLESALDCQVDLVTLQSLNPHMGPRILEEACDVLRAA